MTRFSPKIEIINHFDNLINRVDIDIDHCLEKYNDELLKDLLISSGVDSFHTNMQSFLQSQFKVITYETINWSINPNQAVDIWPESTKVIDYLKQIRMRTIDVLKKEQEETLEKYKINSERFKSELNNYKSTEELRRELFDEKFYFQIQIKKPIWAFNLFTFVIDFYMSQSEIESLEKMVNNEKEPFSRDTVFDERIVLISLVYYYFILHLILFPSHFPSHLIHISKQDVVNIKCFHFKNDFSGVNFNGKSKINLSKIKTIILGNRTLSNFREVLEINIDGLPCLEELYFGAISENTTLSIYSNYANYSLQELELDGNLSYFNLDNFINLTSLTLDGSILETFNFELFKNLCNQLKDLSISFDEFDEKSFFKLFDGIHFSNLKYFYLSKCCCMKSLKKNFFDRFPTIQNLGMDGFDIEIIEHDAFSNLEQLEYIDLSYNLINFIEKNAFSNLKNLKLLDLSSNQLTFFDPEFIGLGNSVQIILNDNDKFPSLNQ